MSCVPCPTSNDRTADRFPCCTEELDDPVLQVDARQVASHRSVFENHHFQPVVIRPVRRHKRHRLRTVVAKWRRNPRLIVHLDKKLPPVSLYEFGLDGSRNHLDPRFGIDVDADKAVRIERSLNHTNGLRLILFFPSFAQLLLRFIRKRRAQVVQRSAQTIDLNENGLRILARDKGQFGG